MAKCTYLQLAVLSCRAGSLNLTSVTLPKLPVPRKIVVSKSLASNFSCTSSNSNSKPKSSHTHQSKMQEAHADQYIFVAYTFEHVYDTTAVRSTKSKKPSSTYAS
jgi:hypothetical protein